MAGARFLLLALAFGCLLERTRVLAGETDPLYRECLEKCLNSGYIGQTFFPHCQKLTGDARDKLSYLQEPLYLRWRQWNCRGDCHYNCMIEREKERHDSGLKTIKYLGRWPFKRIYVLQEPVSAMLSALNLMLQFHGWLSFLLLVFYKLPLRPQSKQTYYEYTSLWTMYALLAMNALLWSTIFHIQEFDLGEQLDQTASAVLVGYMLVLAIIRTFDVRAEASRVMVAAPLLAFIITHAFYLNFYELNLVLNAKICFGMYILQLFLWAVWVGITNHPARDKMWMVVFASSLSLLLEIDDLPPYKGYIDSHALSHLIAIPVTYLLWSFVKEDARFRTSTLINKAK